MFMSPVGEGISGSDRILIELAKRWQKKIDLTIITWSSGRKMLERQSFFHPSHKAKVIEILITSPYFLINYFERILASVAWAIRQSSQPADFIYSGSEFWMDSFPAIILKLKFPSIKWIAAWYQTAPSPKKGFGDEKSFLRSWAYWLVQLPIKYLITKFADYVFVNNELEKNTFPSLSLQNKAIVVLGAINLREIKAYNRRYPKRKKIFDAVFQGRFHPQKGVIGLIGIWSQVVSILPKARLAMIGDGPLMSQVKSEIRNKSLDKNITLFGFVFDGEEKYKIFSSSQLVVHPSVFDSGGMASAEAMAFGIPAVGFDLPAYKDYYPRGMVKVTPGKNHAFAAQIVGLLQNDRKRSALGKQAQNMIELNWSWEKRANQLLNKLIQI